MDATDLSTLTVTGGATPEELAAVVDVLLALGDDAPATHPAPSRWADRGANLRAPAAHRGAWRHPHR